MREIKFRAWDEVSKQMGAVKGFQFGDDGLISTDIWLHDEVKNAKYWVTRAFPVVMQYSGLKDKNGKEIYEGDFLIDDDSEPCRHRIVWMEDKARWELETLMDESGAWDYGEFPLEDQISYETGKENMLDSFEIIGNIYENPELLKV